MMFFRAALFFATLAFLLGTPCPSSAAQGLGASPGASVKAPPASNNSGGADFSKMPIEDAIMAVFMLMSEDARKDMKGMMDEMAKTRLEKQRLREAEKTIKDQLAGMRDKAKAEMLERELGKLNERKAALEARQRRVQRAVQRRQAQERQEAEERRAREQRAAARRERQEQREAEERRQREQRTAARRQRAEQREQQEAEERSLRAERAAARRARRDAAQEDKGKEEETKPPATVKPVTPSPCPASNPNCLHKPVGTFQTTTPPKTIGQIGGQSSSSSSTTTTTKTTPAQLPHGSLTLSPVKPVSPALLKPGTTPTLR